MSTLINTSLSHSTICKQMSAVVGDTKRNVHSVQSLGDTHYSC